MIHRQDPRAVDPDRPSTGGSRAALMLLSASVVGVIASVAVWVTYGWVDALAGYVITIGVVLLLLLRQTYLVRAMPAESAAAWPSPPVADPAGDLVTPAGLSLAERESGMRRLGG